MSEPRNPFILVNTFTAVEGGIDELLAFQLAEMRAMAPEATACGWLGNEVYLSEDAASLIVITRFRSKEAHATWAATERSRRHVDELMPLVTGVSSVPVRFLAAHGTCAIDRQPSPASPARE